MSWCGAAGAPSYGQRNRPFTVPSGTMLSVIVPTNESERVLVRTLACLVPGATAGLIRDLLLADAGSKDETEQIADIAGCRFVAVPGPLGPRLSAAVAEVRGDWLLFLKPGAELDPGWVGEVTHYIERAPADMAAVFIPEQTPKGQGSLWSDLLEVFRARQSVLKPGRGLLISRSLYRQLGGHRDVADPEADLLARIGKARISGLRSAISFREP